MSPSSTNLIPGSTSEPPSSLSTTTSDSSGTSLTHKVGTRWVEMSELLFILASWYLWIYVVNQWISLHCASQVGHTCRYKKHLCVSSAYLCLLHCHRCLSTDLRSHQKTWGRTTRRSLHRISAKLHVAFSSWFLR